ncbi:NUDIX domain-containing protein [Streptomyces lycii]|uniref:NUDIX hydrolase n=1 Tax=Streptomyces lycii TaxID=2654337 RepID=A0ABQ7FGL6_9ACTN|nr:NUDIX hydrolase [Streptomyces lycii]KAF4407970.1 NUDIX hydrolase [Streptomyces lycii]
MGHRPTDYTNPPPRRLGAVVLVRDSGRRTLPVHLTCKDGWILPGGSADAGGSIAEAASRELKEETGLVREVTHFPALDQVPANPETGSIEGLYVVCDGGVLTEEEAKAVAIPSDTGGELSACAWVSVGELDGYAKPYQSRRSAQALTAAAASTKLPLLSLGEVAA